MARRMATNIERMATQKGTPPRNSSTSLEVLGSLFLRQKEIEGLTLGSIQQYSLAFNYFAKTGFPADIALCTTEDIEEYIGTLLDGGMKPVTVNAKLRSLKALINWAYERQHIPTNPIRRIKFIRHEKHLIKSLDVGNVKALLHQCADGTFVGVRDHALILLFLDTGARATEILSMHLYDLDVERCSITVMGKGRKARRLYYSEVTSRALALYLDERSSRLPHDYVWVAEDNAPYRLRSLQDRLKDLGQRAGMGRGLSVDIRVSPHTFRHTFAKMYIQNGGDIFTLQKMLGHTSLDMVRNYVEMFTEDVAKAHERFSPVKYM